MLYIHLETIFGKIYRNSEMTFLAWLFEMKGK